MLQIDLRRKLFDKNMSVLQLKKLIKEKYNTTVSYHTLLSIKNTGAFQGNTRTLEKIADALGCELVVTLKERGN